MKDERMTEFVPIGSREKKHQITLDGFRGLFDGEAEPLAEAAHVGVDHHTFGVAKGNTEDDVRGFASHTRQSYEFI